MAADYLSKGLYDRAMAEASRALARGADAAEGARAARRHLRRQGAVRRGARAVPRGARGRRRTSRRAARRGAGAAAARARRRGARGRGGAARRRRRTTSTRSCWSPAAARGAGDPAGALDALDSARRRAPRRAPTSASWLGDIARRSATSTARHAAYRHALELDPDFVAVWFELGRLLMQGERWPRGGAGATAALDAVPTLRRGDARARDAAPAHRAGARSAWRSSSTCCSATPTISTRCIAARRDAAGRRPRPPTRADRVPARRSRSTRSTSGALFQQGVALRAASSATARRWPSWERVVELEPAGRLRAAGADASPHGADLQHIFARPTADARPMAIEGPLRELGIHDVFQLLDLSRKTGVLRVTSELRDNEGTVLLRRRRASCTRDDPQQPAPHRRPAAARRQDHRGRSRARARAQQAKGGARRVSAQILVEMGAITRTELERQVRSRSRRWCSS